VISCRLSTTVTATPSRSAGNASGEHASITPDIVEVIASADEFPVISRVRETHGAVPLALAYDLVEAHDKGEITIRQLAELTGLSRGTTYDLVEALYEILDLADGGGTTTVTPDDVDRDGDLAEQLLED